MLDFLISAAHADAAAPTSGANPMMMNVLMIVGFIAIFYFMILRPQSKRTKAQRELMSQLSKGEEVTFGGGMVGRLTKVGEEFVTVEIAPGTEINVQKSAIVAVLPKGTLKSI